MHRVKISLNQYIGTSSRTSTENIVIIHFIIRFHEQFASQIHLK